MPLSSRRSIWACLQSQVLHWNRRANWISNRGDKGIRIIFPRKADMFTCSVLNRDMSYVNTDISCNDTPPYTEINIHRIMLLSGARDFRILQCNVYYLIRKTTHYTHSVVKHKLATLCKHVCFLFYKQTSVYVVNLSMIHYVPHIISRK